MSNEHPDMHGNPCDEPFLCHRCGREFREEDAYGSVFSDEYLFCSSDCVESFDDDMREPIDP